MKGQPLMMAIGELTEKLQEAIGELTEKLQEAIVTLILPEMIQSGIILPIDQYQGDKPQCKLFFDREAYSPTFFDKLWNEYRICFITYRKNVTDKYATASFLKTTLEMMGNEVDMLISECCLQLGSNNSWYREVRRLTESGHQTAIITNHPTLTKEQIAQRMFSRWTQENFFKYLICDYDFDKVISFGTEEVDAEKSIVNPPYRKLSHRIKQLREKIQRLEAKFYPLVDSLMNEQIEQTPQLSAQHEKYRDQIQAKKEELEELIEERKQLKSRIKVKEMPEGKTYNKLKTESKKLMNLIRMIAYRAETAVANIILPFLENKNAH